MRRSLLAPIPELALAADILEEAADALLMNNLVSCAQLLKRADLRELRNYSYLLAGPINPAIHRQSRNPIYEAVPRANYPRMPSLAQQLKIMERDGFRCRFCESRVISKGVHKVFAKVLPVEGRLGRTNEDMHFGLATLTGSIDHLIPYSRGGTNELNNVVTACEPCNYGRNRWTLDEVEIADPLQFEPIKDRWDGLVRVLRYDSVASKISS